MSEAERRRGYSDNRKLIESDRILSTTFHDSVLYFTGAQVEIMRNLMAYANLKETYVDEYEPGYYLVPTDADFDSIQAIVADLEEVLMGNPNTLWGYSDRLAYTKVYATAPAGNQEINGMWVPANKIWRVTHIAFYNGTSINNSIVLLMIQDANVYYLDVVYSPPGGVPQYWDGDVVLKNPDYLRAVFYGCTAGDNLFLQVCGYIMDVP